MTTTGSPLPPAAARMGQLLEAARSGCRDSAGEIVRELSPMLWHVARAQGLDRAAAADVVQNTWLKLLTSWSDIRSPQALVSWLVTVTKRDAWRVRRSHSREDLVESSVLEVIVDDVPTPEERAVTSAAHQQLWSTMKRLPERCQRLLRVLAFSHRPDYTAISAELGMKHGTIGPTRGRCLAKLRALLIDEAAGGDHDGRH